MNGAPQAAARDIHPALAACVLAVDPVAIGGMSLRMRAGPEREQFLAQLRAMMPKRSFRRLPPNISDGRLFGGLDLAATLRSGRPVLERGLLADADGGVLMAPMAERLSQGLAARLAATLDAGEIAVERDGFGVVNAAQFAVVALDESIDDESVPQSLLDRLAIHIGIEEIDAAAPPPFSAQQIERARQIKSAVRTGSDIARVLCSVAAQLGVDSVRAPMLALKVARLHAALCGRLETIDEDVAVAARLVLAPRATAVPQSEAEDEMDEQQEEQPQESQSDRPDPELGEMEEPSKLDDVVLAAALASIPAGLLAKLQTAFPLKARKSAQGRAGELRNAALRGRAIGARAGDIGSGARLNVVETLRNAAPRQALRHQQGDSGDRRIAIRREDFRVVRYKHRSETATIFVVDASGSSAVHRMAEAKGAIELLLADCYIRRDQVALISFRGRTAELVLPPTRSLARAKRTLASMPGGGGTPLAAAIDAGFFLADSLRRKGVFPTLVFLTDGRANVGRSSTQSRDAALDEAYHAARICRVNRLSVLVVDTSPQPGPAAERLATEIGGRYLALPYADAAVISATIRRISPGDASPGLH